MVSHSRTSQFQAISFQAVKRWSVVMDTSALWKLKCRCLQQHWQRKMKPVLLENGVPHIKTSSYWLTLLDQRPSWKHSSALGLGQDRHKFISTNVGWAGPVCSMEEVPCAAWKRFHVPGRRCVEHIRSCRDSQTDCNLGFVDRPINPMRLLGQARLGLYFSQVI